MYIQPHIYRLQYSTERICAPIGGISTIQWALHCKLDAKYSAHHPVYAMWTVVPDVYNVVTARHIQAWIFNCRYLRCYSRYLDNSMRVLLQPWCQIQRTSCSLRYLYCAPDIYNVITAWHVQASIFNCTYLRCYWRYLENATCVTPQIWCQI
jgi:hypothetical protein